MNKQKSLLTCTMALGLFLGLETTAQAKEWEQSLVINLTRHEVHEPTYGYTKWGFSKDSLVEIEPGVAIVEDITYCPLVAKIADGMQIDNTGWYIITAKIDMRFSRMYGKKGPVFLLQSAEKAEPPTQKVATFY